VSGEGECEGRIVGRATKLFFLFISSSSFSSVRYDFFPLVSLSLSLSLARSVEGSRKCRFFTHPSFSIENDMAGHEALEVCMD
jgi:hypothetical protein